MALDEMMIDGASGNLHCGMRLFRLIKFGGKADTGQASCARKKACSRLFVHCVTLQR